MKKKWKAGDRVTRPVYSDDGTWNVEGDACREHSPKYHGVVVRRSDSGDAVIVVWDGTTTERWHLDHWLDKELKE